MRIVSVNKVVQQWEKGFEVRTKAIGMGSGSHIWRPIREDGEIIQIGLYGRGQGWSDQKEDFLDVEKAKEAMLKEEKKNVSLDDGNNYGGWKS